MTRYLALALFLLTASAVRASDVYFAQISTGNGTGTPDCSNARPLSSHSSGDDVPGNVLHLCGTISGTANQIVFTALNSGTSGSPITLKWESGAVLQAPYFQGNGTIPTCGLNLSGKNYWIVDGGTNGIIQNIANGTGQANQADTCFLNVSASDHDILRNLTFANAYIHQVFQTGVSISGNGTTATATCAIANCGFAVGEGHLTISDGNNAALKGTGLTVNGVSGNTLSYSNSTIGSGTGFTISDTGGGNSYGVLYQNSTNLLIDHNVFHDIRWALFAIYSAANGITNLAITNNEFYNCDHGVGGGSNANGATMAGMLVQKNYFHDFRNWDAFCDTNGFSSPNYCFHHDFYHVWAGGGVNSNAIITGAVIDKNLFYGSQTFGTAWINLESDQGQSSYYDGAVISNNVLYNTDPSTFPPYGYFSTGGRNEVIVNNTILGSSSSQSYSNDGLTMGGQSTGLRFINNVVSQVGYGIVANQTTPAWTQIDYNYYYKHNSQMYFNGSIISFSTWLGNCNGCDTHSTSTATTSPNIQNASPWQPNNGSPVIGLGTNLTSTLCVTTPQICVDFNNVTRPAAPTSWDLGAAQHNPAPLLALTPNPAAFGNQNVGTTSSPLTVTVQNTGGASETLASPYFAISGTNSTDFSNTGGTCANGGTIAAGNSCTTVFTFTPAASGSRSATLSINGTVNGTDSFTGSGVSSAPVLTLTPSPVSFGSQNVGTTGSPISVTIQNTGTAPETLGSPFFSITGTNASDFASTGGSCTTGQVLNPGASCITNFAFTPSATGARSATLTVLGTVNGTDSMTGTGIASNPIISLSPNPISFGSQTVGTTSSPITVTVSNTGTGPEILSTPYFTITGTNASDFAKTGGTCTNGGTIAAGSSCTSIYTFTPSAKGSRTATLTILGTVNATDSMSGTGKPH